MQEISDPIDSSPVVRKRPDREPTTPVSPIPPTLINTIQEHLFERRKTDLTETERKRAISSSSKSAKTRRISRSRRRRSPSPDPSITPSSGSESSSPPRDEAWHHKEFSEKISDNGILPHWESKKPTNIKALKERLAAPRDSETPTKFDFEEYTNSLVSSPGRRWGDTSSTEAHASFRDLILERYDDIDVGADRKRNEYGYALSRSFTNLPSNTGFNTGLRDPEPDIVQGLTRRAFTGSRVPIDDIPGAVLYNGDPKSIVLPHIAGDFENRGDGQTDTNTATAHAKAAYAGAALVYARNQTLKTLELPDPPGEAHIVTFTTDGSNLDIYAHYYAEKDRKYHQFPIFKGDLSSSYNTFKRAYRAIRNAQDLAREESCKLRDLLAPPPKSALLSEDPQDSRSSTIASGIRDLISTIKEPGSVGAILRLLDKWYMRALGATISLAPVVYILYVNSTRTQLRNVPVPWWRLLPAALCLGLDRATWWLLVWLGFFTVEFCQAMCLVMIAFMLLSLSVFVGPFAVVLMVGIFWFVCVGGWRRMRNYRTRKGDDGGGGRSSSRRRGSRRRRSSGY